MELGTDEICTIQFEGQRLPAKEGTPLMVALIEHGFDTASRSVKYHRPRGAFCLAGTCGQCWMRVDDLPNRAACTSRVHPGLTASRENAFPSADVDLFRAADLLFPNGLDHHRLATTPITPLNTLMQGTARRMAGLGTLSTRPPPPAPKVAERAFAVVVVGGGPAGLAAARVTAQAGLPTLLVEARDRPGGQLNSRLFQDEPELLKLLPETKAALHAAGGELWTKAVASGVYREEDRGGAELLVRRDQGEPEERLVRVSPRALVLATGGYEQCPLFAANDLPGHYGARALAELYLRYGVLPGKRVVVADGGNEAALRLERALAAREVEVRRVPLGEVVGARGGTRVKGVELKDGTRLGCELLASAMPVSPAFELARQAGCDLAHQPALGGFAVQVVADTGQTSVPGIFAAGDLTGARPALESLLGGERAGQGARRYVEAA